MYRRIFILLIVLLVVTVGFQVVKILQLKHSVTTYASYWQKRIATPGSLTYVALGDSTAQGIGATKPQLGYVGLLANQIATATGQSVRVVNLSVSGARIEDVIKKQIPELKNYKPAIVTMEIGANDVTQFNAATFEQQYTQLAGLLPAGTVVSNMPYFGGRIRDNTQAIAASQIIAGITETRNLHLVDLQSVTRQKQSILDYGADYFHPSDRGYRNWDQAFWPIVEKQLPTKH